MTVTALPNARPYSEWVQPDRIETAMYTDPTLFDVEMKKIFHRTWVWVGHTSDIPKPGDYITSHVGLEPVIVVRDRKGQVNVLVNRCRHRGSTVCESHKGSAASFVCPYHGWSFAQDGSLRGVPFPGGYAPDFDKKNYGLRRLKVDEYQGLIFASFNEEVEPLYDFLAGAKPWIDLFMKQGGGYPVKTMGEHRFLFPGNWKIQLENTTDAYHFPIVHRSFIDSLDEQAEEQFTFLGGQGYVEALGNGHSVMVMMPDLIDLEANLEAPIPTRFEALAQELAKTHTVQEVRRLVRAVGGTGFNVNLFPNAACSGAFFRILRPIGVAQTEIRHICIGMDGGPEAANRARIRLHEYFQGPMGFGSPDDAEAWTRVQRGVQGAQDLPLMLNRGYGLEQDSTNGLPVGDVSAETGMRAAYAKWKEMMEG